MKRSAWSKIKVFLVGLMCLIVLGMCILFILKPDLSRKNIVNFITKNKELVKEETDGRKKEETDKPEKKVKDSVEEYVEGSTTETNYFDTTKLVVTPAELIDDIPTLKYQYGQDAYVMQNGIHCGMFHFNLVQRLGIWDYNNQKAVAEGVYYSYAFNINLNLEPYLNNLESSKIEVIPQLLNKKGDVIGEVAVLGWNGFEQVAELYKNDAVKNIEICLQPTVGIIPEDAYVAFYLKDTINNVVFDTIYYDLSLLKNATEGPTIKRINEVSKIKSINKAVYSFTLKHVYADNVYLNIESYSDLVKALDVEYSVKLLKTKINSRVVTRFNTFNDIQMNSEIKLGVNTSNDSEFNYTWFANATRPIWADVDEYVPYVTSNFSYIKKDEEVTNVTNRVLSYNLESKNPTYVRISLEFADERKARTDEEMLKFNGRYLVYQIELENRNLQNYYTG